MLLPEDNQACVDAYEKFKKARSALKAAEDAFKATKYGKLTNEKAMDAIKADFIAGMDNASAASRSVGEPTPSEVVQESGQVFLTWKRWVDAQEALQASRKTLDDALEHMASRLGGLQH
jgi:hypothetical protein